jgi:hypothetical protein
VIEGYKKKMKEILKNDCIQQTMTVQENNLNRWNDTWHTNFSRRPSS